MSPAPHPQRQGPTCTMPGLPWESEAEGEWGLPFQTSFSQGPESSAKLRTDCLALSQSGLSKKAGEQTVAPGLSELRNRAC